MAMRVSLWLLALLLAGCVEDAPARDEAPLTDGAADGAEADWEEDGTPYWINVTLQVSETQIRTPASGTGLGGANCVGFDVDRILGGAAVATWSPTQPVFTELELGVFGENERQRITGASPLSLTFGPDARDRFFDDVKIMIQPSEPGIALEQPASIEVSMQAVGGSGRQSQGSCTFG